jgi:prepilin-type N-terminal cleavage/methylation domain-containing protein
MQKKQLQKNKGFTLIETLVAISIFSMSSLALISVLTQGVTDMNYIKNKLTADNLAVEGVEYVRNMRDTYVLYGNNTGWTDFLNKFSQCVKNSDQSCYFDHSFLDYSDMTQPIIDTNIITCSGSCPNLYKNTNTGRYNYINTNQLTNFSRKIEIEIPANLNNGNEVKVYSTVSWQNGGKNYQTTFTESLFNWIQ